MGTFGFPVREGESASAEFDVDAVGTWLTEHALDAGKVTFLMTACMGQDETAGFKVRINVKAEGSVTAPGDL